MYPGAFWGLMYKNLRVPSKLLPGKKEIVSECFLVTQEPCGNSLSQWVALGDSQVNDFPKPLIYQSRRNIHSLCMRVDADTFVVFKRWVISYIKSTKHVIKS